MTAATIVALEKSWNSEQINGGRIYKRGEGGYWGLVLHESKNIFGNPDVVVPTGNKDVLLQFFCTEQYTNSCFCLSYWFLPHYGEITMNLCVCWVVVKFFYILFSILPREWHCWLFHVAVFFLAILQQDGYRS